MDSNKIIEEVVGQIVNQVINKNEVDKDEIELEKEFEKMLLSNNKKKINQVNQVYQVNQVNQFNQFNQVNQINQVNQVYQRQYRPRPILRSHIKSDQEVKLFASASITFYQNSRGYLIANEFRWREQKNFFHPIGGKVEPRDWDILFTAVREFVEETNFFLEKSITEKNSIYKLTALIYNQIADKVKYLDKEVSPNGPLYHRFFIFNINRFTNLKLRKLIVSLPEFYNELLKNNLRKNTELNYLIWLSDYDYVEKKNEIGFLLKHNIDNINSFV